MAHVTILHNPNCSTSRAALDTATTLGVDAEVIQYLKKPPTRGELERIVTILVDPVTDLVRKDARFAALGLQAADYTDRKAVIDLLVEHPELLQRPVLVKGDRAIIGRPKDRVRDFLDV